MKLQRIHKRENEKFPQSFGKNETDLNEFELLVEFLTSRIRGEKNGKNN